MKPDLFSITVAAGLLLATTSTGWALTPRQHSFSGVVESIDFPRRTIMLKPKEGAALLIFVWNDSTGFTRKGGCPMCSLSSGQTVHGWYRQEVGKNVLREIHTRGASAKCGVTCK